MTEERFLRSKVENNIGVITLNNPPVNALSPNLVLELSAALDRFSGDESVRAVVMGASGTNAFSAGADVKEFAGLSPDKTAEMVALGIDTFAKIEDHRAPTIAAINSLTLGGGLELVLACDMRVSSDRARFGAPETTLGLIPGWGGTQRLPRLVGPAKAKELIFTGQIINAQEALRIGLINKVVPDGDELMATMAIARTVAVKASPLAVAAAKRAINDGWAKTLREGLSIEAREVAVVARSEDAKEGIAAFMEKRQPQFKGKGA